MSQFQFEKHVEQKMIDHMNEDHIDALHDYCRVKNIDTNDSQPTMVAIDYEGFDIEVNNICHRFEFMSPCTTAEDVRHALVELAKQARKKLTVLN